MGLKLCGTFGARLRHALCALALVIGAALVCMAPAFAQGESSGGISGSVRLDDQPVGAADVTVRNLDTGLTRTVVADGDGRFRLALLPVGDYEVTAQSPTQKSNCLFASGSQGKGGVAAKVMVENK